MKSLILEYLGQSSFFVGKKQRGEEGGGGELDLLSTPKQYEKERHAHWKESA
jgi:hypothetical protein